MTLFIPAAPSQVISARIEHEWSTMNEGGSEGRWVRSVLVPPPRPCPIPFVPEEGKVLLFRLQTYTHKQTQCIDSSFVGSRLFVRSCSMTTQDIQTRK